MARPPPTAGTGAPSKSTTAATGSAGQTPITFEQVVHMISESEAKHQSEMKALESSINQKLSRLDRVPTLWQITSVVGVGFAGFLAILAFAGDRFDGGIQFSTVAMQQTIEAKQLSEKTAQQLATQQ